MGWVLALVMGCAGANADAAVQLSHDFWAIADAQRGTLELFETPDATEAAFTFRINDPPARLGLNMRVLERPQRRLWIFVDGDDGPYRRRHLYIFELRPKYRESGYRHTIAGVTPTFHAIGELGNETFGEVILQDADTFITGGRRFEISKSGDIWERTPEIRDQSP